jgi:hypothetical protein
MEQWNSEPFVSDCLDLFHTEIDPDNTTDPAIAANCHELHQRFSPYIPGYTPTGNRGSIEIPGLVARTVEREL